MRRLPSSASARSFTSCLFVVAMCPFSFSGGQKPLMLSLLPFDPEAGSDRGQATVARPQDRGEIVRAGEPVVDGAPELWLAAQPRREHEVRDLEVEGPPQLGERPELVQLAKAVTPVAGRGAARDDEPEALEIAEHPRRPARVRPRLPDLQKPVHRPSLTRAC